MHGAGGCAVSSNKCFRLFVLNYGRQLLQCIADITSAGDKDWALHCTIVKHTNEVSMMQYRSSPNLLLLHPLRMLLTPSLALRTGVLHALVVARQTSVAAPALGDINLLHTGIIPILQVPDSSTGLGDCPLNLVEEPNL